MYINFFTNSMNGLCNGRSKSGIPFSRQITDVYLESVANKFQFWIENYQLSKKVAHNGSFCPLLISGNSKVIISATLTHSHGTISNRVIVSMSALFYNKHFFSLFFFCIAKSPLYFFLHLLLYERENYIIHLFTCCFVIGVEYSDGFLINTIF